MRNDTIVAQASAVGAAGVAVVRVSGPLVPEIIAKLKLSLKPRYAKFAALTTKDSAVIDHGLWLYFQAPNSFTGEHVLEFQGHGNHWVIAAVIQRFCELGCRLAEPGEFSKRAFLNDKIDLVQAEAIADLVSASSEVAAKMALSSLSGKFSELVNILLESVITCRVELEAAMDFPEEDFEPAAQAVLKSKLINIAEQLANVLVAAERGALLQSGIEVVLLGPPNVGKSSLFNALLGRSEAIVTNIAGTTRDVLKQECRIGSATITLQDTAGIRSSEDEVEQQGITRALERVQSAKLVIIVLDERHTELDHKNFMQEFAVTDDKIILKVWNKIDLINDATSLDGVLLSAKTGQGLNDLIIALEKALADFVGVEDGFLARARHVNALKAAAMHTHAALAAMSESAWELAAEDCRLLQRELNNITGEFTNEDLLTRIFSSFCIGK